jgi:hypothetical protein
MTLIQDKSIESSCELTIGEAHRFAAPFKQKKTDFVLEVVDLAADARLRDVKFRRGARNILLFRHGDEVTEMAQL